jgi:quinolinate synthase
VEKMNKKNEILKLKEELGVLLVAHYYQRDEVFDIADITGDSLELARKCRDSEKKTVVFCGVGFMGQSVKILSPEKKVYMPRLACCSMARMIDSQYFDDSVKKMQDAGIKKEDIFPLTYINSNADVKAKVAEMGGVVCTSSSAEKIITYAMQSGKKILFVPDRCLGVNTANKMGLKSCILGDGQDMKECDVICYDGFCSIHQLFCVDDIEFYRAKYHDILIAVHPECDPSVVAAADFVGSTSQILAYVKALDVEQKVAVGTEFNLVNRLREKNTYVLSSTKPECPTMNETTLEDVYNLLLAIKENVTYNEIILDEDVRLKAKASLDKMLEITQ